MREYKVFLDAVDYTSSVDIADLSIGYERDIVDKGFLTKYGNKVTFHGASYEYLNSRGVCDNVSIEIQAKCLPTSSFETIIEGYIIIQDLEFYDWKCQTIASIEDNSVSATLFNARSRKISMEAGLKYIRNFQYGDGTYVANTFNADYAKGITVFNAFDRILNEISNGALRFKSDFFSTKRTSYRDVVNMSGLSNGDITTITIEDTYRNIYNIEFNYDTAVSDNINANGLGTTVATVADTNEILVWVQVLGPASFRLTVDFLPKHMYITNVVTSGAGSVSLTHPSVLLEGMGQLYITNGNKLSNVGDKQFFLTFQQLYDIVNKLFDLSYQFVEIAGQWYVQVEPVTYFLNNAVTLNVGEINETTRSFFADRVAGGIILGQISGYTSTYLFNTLTCNDFIDRALDDSVRIDNIESQIDGTVDYGNDLFLFQGLLLGSAWDEPYIPRAGVDTPIGDSTQYYYNLFAQQPENLLLYHLPFLPDAVSQNVVNKTIYTDGITPTVTVITSDHIGTGPKYIENEKFIYPISFSEFQNLNGLSLIEYSVKGETKYGYIETMEHRVETGTTEINLLVQ